MYLTIYDEYLSEVIGILEDPIDANLMRTRYGALLDYGIRKIEDDAISDSEAPKKPKRTSTDEESINKIEIH